MTLTYRAGRERPALHFGLGSGRPTSALESGAGIIRFAPFVVHLYILRRFSGVWRWKSLSEFSIEAFWSLCYFLIML